MKTSTLAASITAGVVLIGGGIWAATTLPASDEATEPETAYTGSYEPVETETPVESVEPTEAVETPDAGEATGPEVPAAAAEFAAYIRPFLAPLDFQPTDVETFEALALTCGAYAAGESSAEDPIAPFADADPQVNQIFVDAAIRDYC